MAWRSSPASRFVSRSPAASRSPCCRAFPPQRFHAFVAPVIRARAGLAPEAADKIEATVPVRIPSELGRQEFVLVSLVAGEDGPVASPSQKGSGAVTSFSEADGFIEIDALAPALDSATRGRL